MVQSQNWCFTFFENPDQNIQYGCDRLFEMAELEKTNIASVAFGIETCPKTQREHLQGFLQLYKKGMSRSDRRGLGIVLPETSASELADFP